MGAAALTAAGAYALHQLRYLLEFGDDSSQALADQGHAYLAALAGPLALVVAMTLGIFALRLARPASRARRSPPPGRLGSLWAIVAAGLLGIYVGQELLEGWLSSGHPPGLEGVFGSGGWTSLPLAALLGGVIALVLRGARALLQRVEGRRRSRRPVRAPRLRDARTYGVLAPRLTPLAAFGAERAPPR